MADERNNPVLEHLRAIRSEFGEFREDMQDVKGRLTSLEVSVAGLRGEVAGGLDHQRGQ